MNYVSLLPNWNIKNKHVILRLDLNIPLKNGVIEDDFKLIQSKETIDYLIKHNATICILTHIGRPENSDPSLSTEHLLPWFKDHNYDVSFAPSIKEAYQLMQSKTHQIILMQNIRFFAGEQSLSLDFAHELATLGDYYVNDAFGAMHRNETSISLLPTLFMPTNVTIGFLVEKELKLLNKLLSTNSNTTFVLGGKKVKTKLPLLKHVPSNVDHVLLAPALVFTFLQAQDISTGASYVEPKYMQDAQEILIKNRSLLHFPRDYQISKQSITGPYSVIKATNFEKNDIGISIGPETVKEYTRIIEKADKIFFNGAFGFHDLPETMSGLHKIFEAITQDKAFSVIAGGDSVAAFRSFSNKRSVHLCTGGGSALTYLAGQPLPGLQALFNRSDKNQEGTSH